MIEVFESGLNMKAGRNLIHGLISAIGSYCRKLIVFDCYVNLQLGSPTLYKENKLLLINSRP